MKTLKTFLFCMAILAFISCKNDRSPMDDTEGNTLDINDNAAMDRNYNQNSTELNSNTNNAYTDMYRQINMSPEQIERFERENPNYREVGTSGNATLDNSLREILDTNQYTQYETWRDNRMNNTGNNNPNNGDTNDNSNTNTNRNNNDRNTNDNTSGNTDTRTPN